MMSNIIKTISSWKYKTIGVCMDGGTLILLFNDPLNHERQITLIQYMHADYYEEVQKCLPGRIYIEKELVEKRSELESTLLQFLKNKVFNRMSPDERELLTGHLSFIKSDTYLNFAPVRLELSERRKKYLQLIKKIQAYNLNNIERKFLDLKNKKIKIEIFEKWVYANEETIIQDTSQMIFNELIILDYKNKHLIPNLIKIISIDFRKLELYQLCKHLEKLIYSEKNIKELKHSGDDSLYDPYSRHYFSFRINEIEIGMNNPFAINSTSYSFDNKTRSEEFKKRFKKPYIFFELIISNLNSKHVKIVVNEELNNETFSATEINFGTKNDVIINIDKHRLIINKDFLITEMKEYWE